MDKEGEGEKGSLEERGDKRHGDLIFGRRRLTDQRHEASSQSDEGACRKDDQGELPASDEAHAEATDEGGEALDEDAHLVRDGVVDLVDVTVTDEGGATQGLRGGAPYNSFFLEWFIVKETGEARKPDQPFFGRLWFHNFLGLRKANHNHSQKCSVCRLKVVGQDYEK